MRYFGHVVIARAERPLSASPALAGATVLHEIGYAGGWHWAKLDGDLPGGLESLVAESGAPALLAYIVEKNKP
jgi:hypothetical protein